MTESTRSLVTSARISKVVFPLERPFASGSHHITHIRNVVVELSSGEVAGSGFTFAFKPAHADATYALAVALADEVVGREVRDVRTVWGDLWRGLNFVGQEGPPVMALAAVDLAMWDLHARVAGLPLHSLLGTATASWSVYCSGGSLGLTTDELVAEALTARDSGFAAYKFRVGKTSVEEDDSRVSAVRDAVGEAFELMVDANQGWSRRDARTACRRLERHRLGWIEEPLVADDVEGLAQLRHQIDIPIAAGETVYGVAGLHELIRADAVDFLQPDLMRCGGLTPFLDVSALASAHRVAVMPHLYSDHSSQVMGLLTPGAMIEYLPGWFDHLYGPPLIHRGGLRPSDEDGTGRSLRAADLEPLITDSVEVTA